MSARHTISIDGTVRTNRDGWETAVEAASLLKNLSPYNKVTIRYLVTGVSLLLDIPG